jgi:hypothetical protein
MSTTATLKYNFPETRNIGSIYLGCSDWSSIIYNSQDKISNIVMDFIEKNGYLDAGFKINYDIIEVNTGHIWDVSHNMKVKNRVPYIIEISAVNHKSWCATIYSKKPVKTGGYSNLYLMDFIRELKIYLIENQDSPKVIGNYPGEIKMRQLIPIMIIIWCVFMLILS